MALSLEEKKEIVKNVSNMALESSSLVIADARGVNVSDSNALRSDGYSAKVKFVVAKNTLVKLALKDTNYEGIENYLMDRLC